MRDGSVHEGTMVELQEKTGVSRMTLYDRWYRGPFVGDVSKLRRTVMVLKVEKIQEAPPQIKGLSNRFIDYRKGHFQGEIIYEQ